MSPSTPSWVRTVAVLGGLLIGLVVLSACGGAATPAPAAVAATSAPEATAVPPTAAPTDTVAPPTATLAPTATAEPTTEPTAESTATVGASGRTPMADATNCITCHTNEETLKLLAKEEAPKEKLSEGEG